MLIPSKHTGHTRDGVRRLFIDGGGEPAQSTTQTVDLPPWAKETGKEALGAASSLVFNRDAQGNITGFRPYTRYTEERGAQFTPLQQQAFTQAGQQGVAGQIGQATGIAGQAATGALGAGAGFSPYQTGQFGAQAASYMSPYMQNVVGIQQREAQRQADIAGTQLQAQATKAGAFGGGRQAIVEAEAARNLALQKGDIQAQGLQAAYDQAQRQFNTEQQLAEQSRQYGAGLGLQGFQTALQGAGTLGTLGGQQFGQQMDITGQQAQLGQFQQQQVQAELDRRYQDFLNEQKAPYQQLEFLQNNLRGLGSTTSIYSPQPSLGSQLIGAGTTLAGFAAAEGGEVPGYADGGITALLGDEQLAQRQQMPTISTLARLAAEKEAAERAQLRQGLMAAQQAQAPTPQGTVADEVAAGLMAADVPDDMFAAAEGGIVAFQSGGYTPFYQQAYEQVERKGSIYDPYFGRPPEERARLKAAAEAEAGRPLDEQAASDRAFLSNLASGIGALNRQAGAAIADAATLPIRGLVGAYDTAVVRPMRAAGVRAGYLSPLVTPEGADPASMMPFYDRLRTAQAAKDRPTDTGDETRRLASRFPAPPKPKAGLEKIAPPTGAATTGAATTGAATTGAPRARGIAAALPAAQGIPTAEEIMAQSQKLAGEDPSAKAQEMRDRATQTQVDAIRRAEEAQAAEEKALGPVGAEREKRIAAKEERVAADEKKNFKNTLIEAGLAIMAGQSPNALTNIAQGAAAGLKGYQARLNKYEAARDKLDEDRILLEELRREAAVATGARKRQADQEIAKLESAAMREQANMLSAAYGTKSKAAMDAVTEANKMRFTAGENAKQRASSERMVAMQMAGGAGGAGGGRGSARGAVTEKDLAEERAKAFTKYNTLGIVERAELRKAGINSADAYVKAHLAQFTGAPVQSSAAPAATGWGAMSVR